MELSSTADQRFPKALDRCLKGTPKIDTDLLQRINRFASLGLPRRVPLSEVDGHDAAPSPVDNPSTTKETGWASEGVSENSGSSIAPKNGIRSLDSRDVRKRRADIDVSSCRECPQPKQTQVRASKNNLGLPANRKAIELVKEVFEIQDKENSSPRVGGQRREIRKQPVDRSGEKRPLRPSNKLPNVQGGRKIGSLLTKGHAKATYGPRQHEDYEIKDNRQAASLVNSTQPPPLKTKSAEQQPETDIMNTSDSMSISQPLQLGALCNSYSDNSQKGMLVPLLGQAHAIASSIFVDNSNKNFGSTSLGELSFSMSSLAISDSQCPEIVQLASLPNGKEASASAPLATSLSSSKLLMGEKGQPLRNHSPSPNFKYQLLNNKYSHSEANNNINMPFILDAKQDALNAQVAQLAPFSVLHGSSNPSTSASACSITVRSGSAPLATSLFSGEALIGEKGQPLRHHSPSPNLKSELLNSKCSHSEASADHASVSDLKAPLDSLLTERRQPSAKVSSVEGGTLKKGQDRSSQDENVMSERGVAKLAEHSHAETVLEKRIMKGEDPNVQLRKQQVETEHFVWVNGKRYQKMKKIGRGGSSEVYMVIDRDCNIYALKRIKLKGRDYATARGFYQEIEYLNKLHGKSYIICLIDHEVTDKDLLSRQVDQSSIIKDDVLIYMVLEYGEIDLAHMLEGKLKERSHGNNEVDETWLRFYWRQILEAVNTIHEERIVHSDLKPANFLLVKGALKLIDFGIAKSIQNDTTHIERDAQVGTLNYMSPEAFLMNEEDEHGNVIKCGRPSDIWSLGCILYQMVYGKTPFAHITKLHAKIQEVANPNHKIEFLPLSNPHLADIMKKCLAWKKEERLRIPQLLNHPFLQPQLAQAPAYNGKEAIDVLLHIQKEHELDTEVKVLTNQLLDRLKLLNHAMDM